MRVLLLLICVALSACAARWVNPRNPTADLQADTASCDKEAERVARLNQLIGPAGSGCYSSRDCTATAETQNLRITTHAVQVRKQCMAARGWRQD